MGTKVRQIKWGVSILIFSLIIVISLGDYQNIKRDLFYRHHSKISLGYVFGYLPNLYYKNFSERVLLQNDKYILLDIRYNLTPIENHNYIIFTNIQENNSKKMLIDSDAFFLNNDDFENFLSSQLNIETFNEYIAIKNVTSTEAIKHEFFKLISNYDNQNYLLAQNDNEIKEFTYLNPKGINDKFESYIILIKDFEPNFDKYHYVWLEHLGLFEISFNFENNELVFIKDQLVFGPLALFLGTVCTPIPLD